MMDKLPYLLGADTLFTSLTAAPPAWDRGSGRVDCNIAAGAAAIAHPFYVTILRICSI